MGLAKFKWALGSTKIPKLKINLKNEKYNKIKITIKTNINDTTFKIPKITYIVI